MLPQHPTEGILRERLAQLDHAPRYGHALLGFEQDANSVSARVTSAEGEIAIRARYLLGADGGRSFMCKTLGVDFPGESLGARGGGRPHAQRPDARGVASLGQRRRTN
jgi:2-polyprenyl-6-methoxyphenol hydroxylase-like FAD-dependent oxidoreductase